mmetsp:Transcript_41948/g.82049  ORF Transcript_41948/g.82049 Transcript_41948/m.82049 type:complete len:207 (+) Transcript_41948:4297-4917(+)
MSSLLAQVAGHLQPLLVPVALLLRLLRSAARGRRRCVAGRLFLGAIASEVGSGVARGALAFALVESVVLGVGVQGTCLPRGLGRILGTRLLPERTASEHVCLVPCVCLEVVPVGCLLHGEKVGDGRVEVHLGRVEDFLHILSLADRGVDRRAGLRLLHLLAGQAEEAERLRCAGVKAVVLLHKLYVVDGLFEVRVGTERFGQELEP